jgi:ubiquinone/menaquinone biosynthesis C-methylase UbiE
MLDPGQREATRLAAVTSEARDFWDAQARTYDDEPDHGLLEPSVREAWAELLLPLMPRVPASIVDLGCGTGSLSVLLAGVGHAVQGLDISGRMLAAARHKAEAAGVSVAFRQGDAQAPPVKAASVDVVLARHVLWALSDPSTALRRWAALLKPGGVLILVEGRWSTGAGLAAAECERLVRGIRQEATVERLDDPALWGGRRVRDERYLLISRN